MTRGYPCKKRSDLKIKETPIKKSLSKLTRPKTDPFITKFSGNLTLNKPQEARLTNGITSIIIKV